MTLSTRFFLLNASLDRFLFASIGEQENGMPLSVASALARLGGDPWVEAGRLAQLPRDAATEALVAIIARISPARVTPADAPGIAARLVLLLPSGAPGPSAVRTETADPPRRWFYRIALVLCLALLAFAAFNLVADRRPAFDLSSGTDATSTP